MSKLLSYLFYLLKNKFLIQMLQITPQNDVLQFLIGPECVQLFIPVPLVI
jgi:hypothetical protein